MYRQCICWMVALIWCVTACAQTNPITNGGFEHLDAQGRPVDWELLGDTVTITTEAHSGRHALRFERGSGRNVPWEIGLNRSWRPDSGEQGKMLAERKGGIVFWYKLVSASPGAEVSVQVIPMSGRPFEDTGSARVIYRIPHRHAGDGQWHQGKLPYDFTDNPKVKWVHVGVRLTGAPAVLLVDDMVYVEQVGALLRFEKMHFYPNLGNMFTAAVVNSGDAPSQPVTTQIVSTSALQAKPLQVPPPRPLTPGDAMVLRWRLEGALEPRSIRLLASDGVVSGEEVFTLSPRVELLSALMKPAIIAPNGTAELVVTVWNRGTAVARGMRVVCNLPRGQNIKLLSPTAQALSAIHPGQRLTVKFKLRAAKALGEWQVGCTLQSPQGDVESAKSTLIVTDALNRSPQYVAGLLWIRRGSDRVIGELRVGNRVAARMPHLGSVVVRLPDGSVQRLFPRYGPPRRMNLRSPMMLTGGARDRAGGQWTFTLTVQPVDSRLMNLKYACVPDKPRDVLAFEGPILLVGDGSTADAKTEAIFPGLEWLTAEEVSSSDLDIAKDHPDRVRFIPHPHKVTIPAMAVKTPVAAVGLLWNVHDPWGNGQSIPQPVFAVPDRLKGTATHRLGLIAPNVPAGLGENQLTARKPLRITPRGFLRLSAHVYMDTQARDALGVVTEWFQRFRPDPPLPAPQGDDIAQLAWSMRAYTDSLWVSEEQGWLPFQGGPPIWSHPAPRPDFVYDLVKALILNPQHPESHRWRTLVDKMLPRIGVPQADDMGFEFGDALSSLNYLQSRALELIQSQNADGSWGFNADLRDPGIFKGMDYHELGDPGAVELGTCARNAYEILRYARLSGSLEAYRVGAKTLEYMRRFSVPRAAQVWEVPVHTPDILAAADAIDAYIEAYWFSGEERWLREARRWADAGLPFVYVWNAKGKPWMRYGSIPVFGATWYQGSWFGHIVQWNGLRYAYALFKLYEADPKPKSLWREVAIGITRCAMHQQSESGKNIALWPDSYHTVTDIRVAWDFAPRMILKNVYHLIGREEEPRTLRLPSGIRLSSSAAFGRVRERADEVHVELRNPPGERGQLLVCCVEEPQEVLVNGQPVPKVDAFGMEVLSGWRYASAQRALAVRFALDGAFTITIRGITRTEPPALPSLVTRLQFEFARDTEGWIPANHLAPLEAEAGVLRTRSTGVDPFMIRPLCQFAPDSVRNIRIRLRGVGSRHGQFYWSTVSQPGFDESRVLNFELPLDGHWHEVVIPVGEHPLWRGQTITAIRLDPGGAPDTQLDIDWIRGE